MGKIFHGNCSRTNFVCLNPYLLSYAGQTNFCIINILWRINMPKPNTFKLCNLWQIFSS
jgi:hypothetical protein